MKKEDFKTIELTEKELKIIESAIEVFTEKGFSAATTSEIAKKAGVAEGTIFRYFKTKKDILRGVLIQTINLFSRNLVMAPVEKILLKSDDKDLRTILKELLYDRMELMEKFFPMARIVLTEALYHEDIREAIYNNLISVALETFNTFHKKMVEKGMIREDIDGEALFRTLIANMFIFVAQRKLFGDKFPNRDINEEIEKMLDVLLNGIENPKRSQQRGD